MLSPENLQPLTELPEQSYSLPAVEKPVEMFKGEKFNVMELAVQLKKIQSIDRLFENRALDNRPPPAVTAAERFPDRARRSQRDDERAGGMRHAHVIKGRIVKETKTKIGGRKRLRENGDTGDHV